LRRIFWENLNAGGLYLECPKLPVVLGLRASRKSQTLTEAMTSGSARVPDTSLVLRNEGLRARCCGI
jgi:hypothetical protein